MHVSHYWGNLLLDALNVTFTLTFSRIGENSQVWNFDLTWEYQIFFYGSEEWIISLSTNQLMVGSFLNFQEALPISFKLSEQEEYAIALALVYQSFEAYFTKTPLIMSLSFLNYSNQVEKLV